MAQGQGGTLEGDSWGCWEAREPARPLVRGEQHLDQAGGEESVSTFPSGQLEGSLPRCSMELQELRADGLGCLRARLLVGSPLRGPSPLPPALWGLRMEGQPPSSAASPGAHPLAVPRP